MKKKDKNATNEFSGTAARTPVRLQRFPARWSPVKDLRSRNKVRGFAAHIMGKKNINLVFQSETHGDRKLGKKKWWVFLKYHRSKNKRVLLKEEDEWVSMVVVVLTKEAGWRRNGG